MGTFQKSLIVGFLFLVLFKSRQFSLKTIISHSCHSSLIGVNIQSTLSFINQKLPQPNEAASNY